MVIRQIPWKFLMGLLRFVRNTFYSKPQPEEKQFLIPGIGVEELEERLRERAYFEEAEEYTYYVNGEVMNLRRPAGVEDGYQMELHVRAFESEDGLTLRVHREISRFNHPKEHFLQKIFSSEEGKERLDVVLSKLAINHKDLTDGG